MKARKEVPYLVVSANAGGMLIDLPDDAVTVSIYEMPDEKLLNNYTLDDKSRAFKISGQGDYKIVWVDKEGKINTSVFRARFLLGKAYIDLNDIINTDDEVWNDIVKNRDSLKAQGLLSEIKYFKATDAHKWVCIDDLVNGSADKFKNFINNMKRLRMKKPVKINNHESAGDTSVDS